MKKLLLFISFLSLSSITLAMNPEKPDEGRAVLGRRQPPPMPEERSDPARAALDACRTLIAANLQNIIGDDEDPELRETITRQLLTLGSEHLRIQLNVANLLCSPVMSEQDRRHFFRKIMCSLRFNDSEYTILEEEVAFLMQLIEKQIKSLSSYGLARVVTDVLTFDRETRRVICRHPETFFVDTSQSWVACYSMLYTLQDLNLTVAQIDYAGQVLKAVAGDLNVTDMEDIITDWYDAGMFDDIPADWRSSMPPPPFIKRTPIDLRYERTVMNRIEELLFENAPIRFIAGYLERFLFQVSLRIHR